MLLLQLVVNDFLHDVLDDWGPSGHLVRLFCDALLPLHLVGLAAAVASLRCQMLCVYWILFMMKHTINDVNIQYQ